MNAELESTKAENELLRRKLRRARDELLQKTRQRNYRNSLYESQQKMVDSQTGLLTEQGNLTLTLKNELQVGIVPSYKVSCHIKNMISAYLIPCFLRVCICWRTKGIVIALIWHSLVFLEGARSILRLLFNRKPAHGPREPDPRSEQRAPGGHESSIYTTYYTYSIAKILSIVMILAQVGFF